MDVKVAQLLWRCGCRMYRWPDGKVEWKAVAVTSEYQRDEAWRPLKPSRIAIRNAFRRLGRIKGPAHTSTIMRQFGMRKNLDEVPKERWAELYIAIDDAFYAKLPSA